MDKIKKVLYLVVFLFIYATINAATLEVGEGKQYSNIQDAVNAAQPGDIIKIYSGVYEERVEIVGKSDITLVSAAVSDIYGTSEDFRPDLSTLPVIKYHDTEHDHPHNDEEASSDETIDYDENGVILIKESKNIRIVGLRIDGMGVWYSGQCIPKWGGAQLFGNNGIAIKNSYHVEVRYCDVFNAFRGIYIKDRNLGGVYTKRNPGDFDGDRQVPASNVLNMGNHLIERNRIHDNHWGLMFEITWDAPSTVRDNLFYNNYKREGYEEALNVGNGCTAGDQNQWYSAAIRFHGVFFAPHLIHNNTFYNNANIYSTHWGSGVPNIRFYYNLYDKANKDLYNTRAFGYMGNTYGAYQYYSLFGQQAKEDDPYGFTVPTFEWGSGDKTPETGDRANKWDSQWDVYDHEIYYIGADDGTAPLNHDDPKSRDFLVPNPSSSRFWMIRNGVSSESWEVGDPTAGFYDYDGTVADVGAYQVDPDGKVRWAGCADYLQIVDRYRYAEVQLLDNGSIIRIPYIVKYNGNKKITKLEYVLQKYTTTIAYNEFPPSAIQSPDEYDLDINESASTSLDKVADMLNDYGYTSEDVFWVGSAPNFSKETLGDVTNTSEKFYGGRFLLQLKATLDDGSVIYSNVGYFDWRLTEYYFEVGIFDKDGNDLTGENIDIGEPFKVKIIARNMSGDKITTFDAFFNDNEAVRIMPETVDSIFIWVDKNGDGTVQDDELHYIEYLTRMDIDGVHFSWSNGEYKSNLNDDGDVWVVIKQPSKGYERIKVANSLISDGEGSAMQGISGSFKVVAEPAEIIFIEPDSSMYSPETGEQFPITVIVKDKYGHLLAGAEVTFTVEGEIGNFIYKNAEVKEITILTNMDGTATIIFKTTDEAGIQGKVIAKSGDITSELGLYPRYTEKKPSSVYPNEVSLNVLMGTRNLYPQSSSGSYVFNPTTANSYISNGSIVVFDVRLHSEVVGDGTEKLKLKIIITNLQGNVINTIYPTTSDGLAYIYDKNTKSLVENPQIKFTGAGEIEKPKQIDTRVAIPWNHVNSKGRFAEKGVFIVIFEVSTEDGKTFKDKAYYIVK